MLAIKSPTQHYFKELVHIQTTRSNETDNHSRCQEEKEQHVLYLTRGDGNWDNDCPQRKENEVFKVDIGLVTKKRTKFLIPT